MEIKILEDFVALAETGSFSQAATIRHVTQPAFSRRIKSLENWFGVTLVDRSHYPSKLTEQGESLYKTAKQMIADIYQCREDISATNVDYPSVLKFAMPHNLSTTFFPVWRRLVEQEVGNACIKITTGNIHDSAQLLDAGNCDFVLYFEYHELSSACFNSDEFIKIKIGVDRLMPVTKADPLGGRLFDLDSDNKLPLPYLAWGQPSLAEHIVSALISQEKLDGKINLRYQNQLAAALRAETLLGNGIAWLLESIVSEDLQVGTIVPASDQYQLPIDIYIVKKRDNGNELSDCWWNTISTSYRV